MPLVCQNCGHSTSWDTAPVPDAADPIPAPDDFAIAATHRAALAEIQAEIMRFKTYSANYISALERKQAEVQGKLTAIVYPVLFLPPEITSRIFVECLPEQHGGAASALPGCAPVLLMRVCRRWKDIALSTPRLWSSMCIGSSSYHKITVSDVKLDPLSFLPRLGRLHASLSDADIKDIIKNAPILDELCWWRRHSSGNSGLDGVTSTVLTKLHIISYDPISSVDFIAILQNFPSLSDLTCTVKPDPTYRHTLLTFPNLTSLGLLAVSYHDVPPIHVLDLVTLPNLGSLKYESSLPREVMVPFLSPF
ncbi:F-box domain-containing protein [Mycena sanguinolenta]|uniref:F-box domain-containing protein n=1 Tax=Mycena sanguinolenta TaxID=230812 RepID=A0A8H7CQ30_9AGAR|nr:F-box domain-containing protein [Mycena sanguinolenta]